MTKIGIPKAMFYHQQGSLWEKFFTDIGCEVKVSGDTNKKILDQGVLSCSNETCLPVKVFHGHVQSLLEEVDFVFVPRCVCLDKGEFTCPKICALPDMVRLNLKQKEKILSITLDEKRFPQITNEGIGELAKVLGQNKREVISAFHKALDWFNGLKLEQEGDSKGAVLVLGHPYIIYDKHLSMELIQKLKGRGISICTPQSLSFSVKRENSYPYYGRPFWDAGFENLGSAFFYAAEGDVRGVIYITAFGCGIDSFVSEFIERRFEALYNVPLLRLTIDEHTGEAGFDTRVEAFLDMIGKHGDGYFASS